MVRLGEFRTWVVGMAAVLAACSAAAGLAPMTAQTDELRKVLILNSYHAGYKGSDDLRTASVLPWPSLGNGWWVKVEYLDSKEFRGGTPQTDAGRAAGEIPQASLRSLVTTDDYAFDLIEGQRDALRLGAGGVLRHKPFRSRPACRTPGFRGYRRESQFADT